MPKKLIFLIIFLTVFGFLFFAKTGLVRAAIVELWVNSFSNSKTGWTKTAPSPYLDTISTGYISTNVTGTTGDYGFADSVLTDTITKVEVGFYYQWLVAPVNNYCSFYLQNGATWVNVGSDDWGTAWHWQTFDVTSVAGLTPWTWTKVNNALAYLSFYKEFSETTTIRVDAARLIVTYSAAANNIPNATSVTDSPDPVTVGSNITFTGNWTEADAGDLDKMYVCKDSTCTNCNSTSCPGVSCNCWCYSSGWNTQPDTTDICAYTAQAGDVGMKSYWLGVCDNQPSCDTIPLSGGTFTVNASVCLDLTNRINAANGHGCFDPVYDPLADLNKDKTVNMSDSILLGNCGGNEALCQGLWNPSSPCSYCQGLKNRIQAAMGKSCFQPGYDPLADVNNPKDKTVNIQDNILLSNCGVDEACCQGLWNPTSPCSYCLELKNRIQAAMSRDCFQPGYDPLADVTRPKDKKVRIDDALVVIACGVDEDCCQNLWDPTDPCSYCQELTNRIQAAMSRDCFEPGYDPLADVTRPKDKKVRIDDALVVTACGGNEDCCQNLMDPTDPCSSCTSDGCNGNCPAGCGGADDPDCAGQCLQCTCATDNDCTNKCTAGNGCCFGCTPADPDCYFINPLACATFPECIEKIINFIFWIAVAIVPIVIIIAGFLFLTSGGDPEKVRTAKKILLYACIGLVIVLLAKGIISIVKTVIGG